VGGSAAPTAKPLACGHRCSRSATVRWGFWKAVRDVFPQTREQRCWFHKTGNVLAALPKSAHPCAKKALAEITNAENKARALAAAKAFSAEYGAQCPKAAAKITDDLDVLAFCDNPAEHGCTCAPPTRSGPPSAPCGCGNGSPRVQGHEPPASRWRSSCWSPPNAVGGRSTPRIWSRWCERARSSLRKLPRLDNRPEEETWDSSTTSHRDDGHRLLRAAVPAPGRDRGRARCGCTGEFASNAHRRPTLLAASIVAEARLGPRGVLNLQAALRAAGIDVVAFTAEEVQVAAEAWRRFGRGRHPANLNYGDCMSYATAVTHQARLLFVGGDFAKTDVTAA